MEVSRPECVCPHCLYHLEKKKSLAGFGSLSLLNSAANFIKPLEGFRSTPYWDHKQYSWGYGTRAPGPTGTITREKAHGELMAYILTEASKFDKAVTKPLTSNQKIALHSFNYNLGFGNTQNIIDRINKGLSDAEITAAMRLYNKASGVVDQVLVNRRNTEVAKYLSIV